MAWFPSRHVKRTACGVEWAAALVPSMSLGQQDPAEQLTVEVRGGEGGGAEQLTSQWTEGGRERVGSPSVKPF